MTLHLTGGTNDVQTGEGDDIITTTTNLALGDRIDGGNGTDTFEVIHTARHGPSKLDFSDCQYNWN